MKRMMAIVLSTVPVLSIMLSGCESSAVKEDGSAKTGNPALVQSPSGSKQTSPDKYDQLVELSTVSLFNPLLKFENGDDLNNNVWTRHFEQNFNISVKRLWAATSDDEYIQRLNLLIAAGNIPDFFQATPEQFKQLYSAGLIEDLTDVYERDAPQVVKQLMEEAGEDVRKAATIDGKLMAIPWTGLERESVPMVWIRKDWMNKLQLPEPETLDDLMQIAVAFADRDPDGNGKKDTFGFGIDRDLSAIKGFMNAYHAYSNIWIEKEQGKLAFGSIQPEMKPALAKLQELYKEGIIDPDFAVKNMQKVMNSVAANKIGIHFGDWGSAGWPLATSTPGIEWQSYPFPSSDDKPVKLQHDLNIYGYVFVVKKGIKNPEAVFKLLEFWVKQYYFTPSEEDYVKFIWPKSQNVPAVWMLAPIKMYRSFNNLENYRVTNEVLKGKKELSELSPEQRNAYNNVMRYKNGEKMLWWANAQSGENGSGRIIEKYLSNDQFMPNRFTSSPTDSMLEKGGNLASVQQETFIKIIMGLEPLGAFDKFVSIWSLQGGSQITKEVNEWYAKQK
ncbi:hypothetical protein DQG23_06190 [Paenibacillus contaminans]|uniref:ABC transporter substrate-binding protein n=2 Tax=Paenibacillus contaminans TaxID=450362 RepID=A0A329MSI7_9BACL|nr:hypothetical protein DQG23_06190 [Paenibacillus contaminans]